ncbi:MAG: substrate-binding domain-containing protein [Myxococcales bacterium]
MLGLVGSACGGDDGDKTVRENTGKLRVGFVNFQEISVWRDEENRSVQAEAEKRGYELVYRNSVDESRQADDIEELAAMGLDGIFLAPKVVSLASSVVSASKAGVPIILLDRGVDESVAKPGQDYLTLMSSDFALEGKMVAEWVNDHLGEFEAKWGAMPAGGWPALELEGSMGADPAIKRKQGFDAEIAANGGGKVNIVASITANFDDAKAKEVTTAQLAAHPDLKIIYTHNDGMAMGAISAIEAAGLKPSDFMIVSIDGAKMATQAIFDGKMNLTVTCNPSFGPSAFDKLEAFLAGQSLPTHIVTSDVACDLAAVMQAFGNTDDAHEPCDGFGSAN